MRSDWAISGTVHAAVLLFGLVSLASSKPNTDAPNPIAVTIITDADVSRAPMGQQNAPVVEKPKPRVDKIGDPKPIKQLVPKVVEKPEITPNTAAPAPQPKPEPKPEAKPETKPEPKAEAKPDPKPEAKPEPNPKAAEKPDKKPDDFKPDKIANLLNSTKDSQKPTKPQDKPSPDPHKYDANQIADLLDHREAQRTPATGGVPNTTSGLGAPTGAPDAQLSQTEIDALRQRIRECWSPPAGVDAASDIYVVLRVLFKPDGSLAQAPVVVAGSASALGPALAESGKRALLQCQPFTMLRPEHYAQWKDITVNFNPRELSN